MPKFQFEAMDNTGQEIKDVLEAATQDEAEQTIRQMGYYVTKITPVKEKKSSGPTKGKSGKTFSVGRVNQKVLTTFTKQLSVLQDAGLPILRSLKILEAQCKPSLIGSLKNALIDVIEEIEGGATLSEAMAKSPKAFDRLYVNMVKAGEAGGALEVILRRLAEFQTRALWLKRKVRGAMVYPVAVITFAAAILTFIMMKIVPQFQKIFEEFETDLPAMTQILITASETVINYWFLLPGVPLGLWLFLKLVTSFYHGRFGWDLFKLKMPIFGQLVEKNIIARTTRTLGTLVSSGVPILEALTITRETANNAVFEKMFQQVLDAIRDGETISKPMKDYSRPGFHPVAAFFWFTVIPVIGLLLYLTRYNAPIMEDIAINMIDVGEETGELDEMLYKIADNYDEEVEILTESLLSLMEPLLIIVLGVLVGFIVIALFLPLISLIQKLTG
ncbi:type II secretion system F family protein [Thermostilla marina]|nr:MAG: type II secretion system F family protein [Planctomycetota bacterium]